MADSEKRYRWNTVMKVFSVCWALLVIVFPAAPALCGLEPPPWFFVVTVLVFAAGWVAFTRYVAEKRRNEQLDAPPATQVMKEDPRPPVVYLRSFSDERTVLERYRSSWPTEEQQLERALSEFGPFVAVGNPSEPLPELGAARLYVRDSPWEDIVQTLIAESAFVVIRLGNTDGVMYELDMALGHLPHSRILLLNALDRAAYVVVQERLRNAQGIEIPAFAAKPSVLYFDDENRVLRVRIRNWQVRGTYTATYIEVGLRIAMRRFLARLGLETDLPPLDPRRLALLGGALLAFAVGVWGSGSLAVKLVTELCEVTVITLGHIALLALSSVAFVLLAILLVALLRTFLLETLAPERLARPEH